VKGHSVIVGLFLAATIPLVVLHCRNGDSPLRCSLDGSRIEPLYEVVVSPGERQLRRFSCVRSAQIWLAENRARVSSVWVTDEETGEKLEAEQAYYVVSGLITTPHTGNRIHVFAKEKTARAHAGQYGGRIIHNPLRVPLVQPPRACTYAPEGQDRPEPVPSSGQKPFSLTENILLVIDPGHPLPAIPGSSELCRGYSRVPDKPPNRFI
jgi:hypothetical protein